MTTVAVVWATSRTDVAARGYWDQAMLADMFDRIAWRPARGFRFEHRLGFDPLPAGDGAVVIVPARMEPHATWLNEQIARLPWVLVVLSSDEEGRFPWQDLLHENMAVWVQTPDPAVHADADGFLPVGYTPETRTVTAEQAGGERPLDWVFAGQVTHDRRRALHDQLLADGGDGLLLATDTFGTGMNQAAYLATLCDAKVAPCPGGPVNPDTFRLWEALQAGCVPLVDTQAGERDMGGYWQLLFDGMDFPPFPMVYDWAQWPDLSGVVLGSFDFEAARSGAWWIGYQRELAYKLDWQIRDLTDTAPQARALADVVTVVIPTSPVPANPDFSHLLETLHSLSDVGLAGCEVLLTCDGVRDEQAHMADDYHRALARIVELCRTEWPNVLPVIHETHQHQARMMRHALDLVRTPFVVYVEHDCPLDGPIAWWPLLDVMDSGHANLVRFHHEARVLQEHEYLMLGEAESVDGVDLWKCGQWSQRPHVATTDYYRRIMANWFDPEERWMIEPRMHSVLQTAVEEGHWDDHKVWMYHEPGAVGIRHSRHLNARRGEQSWEDS